VPATRMRQARPVPMEPQVSGPPSAAAALVSIAIVQGVTAIAGGLMLVVQWAGGNAGFPPSWLEHIPFDTWLWPGAILGVGLGAGALFVAYGVAKRPSIPALDRLARSTGHHWAWLGALLLGGSLMSWIVVQRLMIPATHWLQPLYFVIGMAIVLLGLSRGVRRWLAPS
jgi:hypothetical protein